jgi:2-haloacid dehalogenase
MGDVRLFWNVDRLEHAFRGIVAPFAGCRTEGVIHAYHRHERALESQEPFVSYRDVLTRGLALAGKDAAVQISDDQTRALSSSWGDLPKFDDVEPMLIDLRRDGYRLAVLTNCDDDLFAATEERFAEPFDLVITAEQVRAYKPATAHFRRFADIAMPQSWVHVACSWYHDIAPARELGVTRIWLDRDNTGEDPSAASARVTTAADVAAAVRETTRSLQRRGGEERIFGSASA